MSETRCLELTEYEAGLLWYHMGDPALEPVRAGTTATNDPGRRDMAEAWTGIRRRLWEAYGPFVYAG